MKSNAWIKPPSTILKLLSAIRPLWWQQGFPICQNPMQQTGVDGNRTHAHHYRGIKNAYCGVYIIIYLIISTASYGVRRSPRCTTVFHRGSWAIGSPRQSPRISDWGIGLPRPSSGTVFV